MHYNTCICENDSKLYFIVGWAASILFNQNIREQFLKFRNRPDTFSLGVCNGCQLMGLLDWVAQDEDQKGIY